MAETIIDDGIFPRFANLTTPRPVGTLGIFAGVLYVSLNAGVASYAVALPSDVLTTQGDILYRNAAGLTRLPAGVAGTFLQTAGPGANPTWATPASGGPTTYSTVATSSTVSNTTARTLFDTTLTIDATTLQAGDVVEVRGWGTQGGGAVYNTWGLSWGGQVFVEDAGGGDLFGAGYFEFMARVVVRTPGAAGVAVGAFVQNTTNWSTSAAGQAITTAIDNTNFATNSAATVVGITVQPSAAATSNTAVLQALTVTIYPNSNP